MQNSDFMTRITSLHGSQTSLMVFSFKRGTLAQELQVSMGPSPYLWFCALTTATLASELLVSMVPALICAFCRQNSVISTKINSLHGSQTSPVVLCIQNNVISIRITSLYGFKPSSVVFAIKRETFGSELQVSMGPSPHLWFLHAKQRLMDHNYMSLRVPVFTCDL